MNELLQIYHPTTVVMLDDDVNFLRSIGDFFDDELFCMIQYDNPRDAMRFFKNIVSPFSNMKDFFSVKDGVCNYSFYKQIYNSMRFSSVSSIISDYEMPGFNGVECFKTVLGTIQNKILLTGIASDVLAVKAVEEKIIDQYLRKNHQDLMTSIYSAIENGARTFFEKISEYIENYKNMVNEKNNIAKNVQGFILDQIKKFKPIEYYLIDKNGSYLFVNEDRTISAFFIYHKSDCEEIYNAFKEEYPHDLLTDLINGRKIICYPYRSEQLKPKDFAIFINDAESFDGEFSYCYVDESNYFIDKSQVTFFDEYKKRFNLNKSYISTISNIKFPI